MKRIVPGWLVILLALAAGTPGCASEGGDENVRSNVEGPRGHVRPPAVAGAFYPGDPAVLASELDEFLDAAPVAKLDGDIVALISPHAGYVYSGAVAANAYVLLRGREFDTVVVVAPSHKFGFRGASVYDGDGYETPLGVVDIDRELASAIRDASSSFVYEPRAHAAEHSLEVQVPFLQRTLGRFELVPIILGSQDEGTVRTLASAIAAAVRASGRGDRVLLVASSDLSHFHQYDEAVALDSVVIEHVDAFDPEGLLRALASGECEACGGGPMAAVMMAARDLGADRARVLKYANSGDVTGDRSGVVGYMSAVLTRPAAKTSAGKNPAADSAHDPPASRTTTASGATSEEVRPYEGLTSDEKHALLVLARRAIEANLAGERPPEVTLKTPALEEKCGAFVTLNERGRLRGCIGYVVAVKPLYVTVREMAVQAAEHDPRFPPVRVTELPDIEIEISVMSPLQEVKDVSEIVVGRDGLVIQGSGHSGLLLPQVATEYGWDRQTFLEHTCTKAGLPTDAWKRDDVTIFRFSAEVFGEKE